ncbi:MAG: hypothetical protein ABIR06_15460 [Cyclobacteriaceae bacterium]
MLYHHHGINDKSREDYLVAPGWSCVATNPWILTPPFAQIPDGPIASSTSVAMATFSHRT